MLLRKWLAMFMVPIKEEHIPYTVHLQWQKDAIDFRPQAPADVRSFWVTTSEDVPYLLTTLQYHLLISLSFVLDSPLLHLQKPSITPSRLPLPPTTIMSTTTKKSNIQLYTDQTPNGVKIPIAMEELGISYTVHTIDISTNKQKEDWFLAINPNGRIPAITDTITVNGKEETIRVFESASILIYLIEQYDPDHKLSYPRGTKEYYEMINWLMFQNAQLGPMQGQSNHFFRYAPEKIEYGINRYRNETRRVYKVLEDHLSSSKSQYLVGDKCTIADCTTIGWVYACGWAGVEIDDFPTLKAWRDRMMARPAVAKGNDVPHPSKMKEMLGDEKKMEEYAKKSSAWIMKGMKDDEKK